MGSTLPDLSPRSHSSYLDPTLEGDAAGPGFLELHREGVCRLAGRVLEERERLRLVRRALGARNLEELEGVADQVEPLELCPPGKLAGDVPRQIVGPLFELPETLDK